MSKALLTVSLIAGALAHDPLDWFTVAQRTCPHEADMEQRVAMLLEAIWFASENIFGFDATTMAQAVSGIFAADGAYIGFPSSIDETQTYFSYPAFVAGLLDMSGQGSFIGVDHIIGGVSPDPSSLSPEVLAYGSPQQGSFYDYLSGLDYSVRMVPGTSYYQCDNAKAWGFSSASVYIKEKNNDPAICRPAQYVGAAQIVTTFRKEVNAFGNDEWMMEEFAVLWEMFSEQEEEECDSSDSAEETTAAP
jgi:hypothetical protein